MFDNACLVTIDHNDPMVVRFRIRLRGDKIQAFATYLKYEYLLPLDQLHAQLHPKFSTCFDDMDQFLKIGPICGPRIPCKAYRGNASFSFDLPAEAFDFLRHGNGVKSYLCHDRKFVFYPRLDFSGAQKTLQAVSENPKARRALCKALRNSFRWLDAYKDEIRFFWDGGKNFFWREYLDGQQRTGMCGGLIYSEYDGKAQYSMHT